jgi:hypothetical protein
MRRSFATCSVADFSRTLLCAVVWDRRAICPEWLKNFAQWNSILSFATRVFSLRRSDKDGSLQGYQGWVFPCFGRSIRPARGRWEGKAATPAPVQQSARWIGLFQNSIRNNGL